MRGLSNKVIAMLLSLIMLIAYAPISVLAEDEKTDEINHSVSGYVSLTEGHKIVGYETSLHLQYGTKEDKSVVRAIGDPADDIETVTGKKSTMRADDDILIGSLPPHERPFPAGKYEFEGYIVGRGDKVGLRFKKTESDSSNFMEIPYPIFSADKADTFKKEVIL